MTDTSPQIAEMVRAKLMMLSGAERFRMGVEMFESARRMVLASLPAGLSEKERKRQLFLRLYGGELSSGFLRQPSKIDSPPHVKADPV